MQLFRQTGLRASTLVEQEADSCPKIRLRTIHSVIEALVMFMPPETYTPTSTDKLTESGGIINALRVKLPQRSW